MKAQPKTIEMMLSVGLNKLYGEIQDAHGITHGDVDLSLHLRFEAVEKELIDCLTQQINVNSHDEE